MLRSIRSIVHVRHEHSAMVPAVKVPVVKVPVVKVPVAKPFIVRPDEMKVKDPPEKA